MNIFISHSWNYGHQYTRLVEILRGHTEFTFRNYSIPLNNPIIGANSNQALENAIREKMKLCSVVLIMAGMYSNYSTWINKEILIAHQLGKPIVAVKPFGAERISTVVRNAAHQEASWNKLSIVNAINLAVVGIRS